MSSQRGNVKKTGPPKHQNKRAFKNNLHDKTNKIKMINSLDLWGLCITCKGVIDWKIKYKKYKPLTQARTCVKCGQKTVKRAYYTLCQPCCKERRLCGKCGKEKEIVEDIGLTPEEEMSKQAQLDQELKLLPERKRRAVIRNMEAGNGDATGATGGEDGEEREEDIDSDISDVGHTDTDDDDAQSDDEIQSAEELDSEIPKTNSDACMGDSTANEKLVKEVSIEKLSLKDDK